MIEKCFADDDREVLFFLRLGKLLNWQQLLAIGLPCALEKSI